MPNLENICKWNEALRSGEYEQARGRLRDTSLGIIGYCCLGVAAKIAGLEIDSYGEKIIKDGHCNDKVLNTDTYQPIWDWLGFSENDHPDYVHFNDGHEWSFTQIADFNERTFLQEETA